MIVVASNIMVQELRRIVHRFWFIHCLWCKMGTIRLAVPQELLRTLFDRLRSSVDSCWPEPMWRKFCLKTEKLMVNSFVDFFGFHIGKYYTANACMTLDIAEEKLGTNLDQIVRTTGEWTPPFLPSLYSLHEVVCRKLLGFKLSCKEDCVLFFEMVWRTVRMCSGQYSILTYCGYRK